MSINNFINILIVDDSEDNLILLEAMLESSSYNIIKASSGEQALELLLSREFALAIMDVQMPGLSGFELAKLIKQNSKIAFLPIIFVTSNVKLSKTILQAYKAGAVDYIFKPIDPEILAAKVAVFAELFKKNKEVEFAREAAIKANEAKSKFLAIISHEIRNPLSGIIGLADLLLDTELTEEQRDFSNSIVSSGQSILMIINDLLDLSKIEANKLKLEENEFSPRQLIEQLTSLFSSALKNKRLELAIFINPHLPSLLKGDSVRLYQILTNLLSNAIKFTEQGTITVEANLAEENQEQVSIMFIISDTGKGIAKSNQSLLFEPYVQEDSSITRKFGGTGLGLSICKKLVELMKGEITLESEIDKGSRFSFTAKFNKALNLENQFNNENTKYLNGISSVVIGKYSIFTTTLIRQLTSWTLQCHTIEKIEDLIKNAPNFLFSQQNIPIIIWDIESINDQTVSFLNKIVNLPNFEFIILLIPFWEQNYFQKLPIKEKVVCLSKPLQPSKLFECLRKFTLKTRPSITRPYLEPLILEPIKENKEKSLLIVEDDEVNQFIIAKQLKHFGYTFDIANSGKEALIAVKNTSYKLFLLNFNLPDINCFELVAQIHKKELEKQEKLTKANHSIVVVLTADISLQEEQNLFEVGVDVFLRKPISTKMLEETLKKWL